MSVCVPRCLSVSLSVSLCLSVFHLVCLCCCFLLLSVPCLMLRVGCIPSISLHWMLCARPTPNLQMWYEVGHSLSFCFPRPKTSGLPRAGSFQGIKCCGPGHIQLCECIRFLATVLLCGFLGPPLGLAGKQISTCIGCSAPGKIQICKCIVFLATGLLPGCLAYPRLGWEAKFSPVLGVAHQVKFEFANVLCFWPQVCPLDFNGFRV